MLKKLYWSLPYPAKQAAASLRGAYLQAWRYGRETRALVDEAAGREYWDQQTWKTWIDDHTAYVLERAATRVPYYRDYWTRCRQAGDRRSWSYLDNWPVLEKSDVRANPQAFVADDCNIRWMFPESTSGTSGTPVRLWWTRKTVRAWYGLFERRCRNWHGVDRASRWAIFGGQLVTPVHQRKPPYWVYNRAMNQLYMSSYHISPESSAAYLGAIQTHRIEYLWGYSSALYALAREALRLGQSVTGLKVALTNAEPLFEYQREAIARAFGCPVRETYGMAEIVAAASECPEGRMHLWPETGHIELHPAAADPVDPNRGELVCTGLLNPDMPLVRYRVGDVGTLDGDEVPCACGRLLPKLKSLEGRADDVVVTIDGRRIGRLDPVFKGAMPLTEAQIVQQSLTNLLVRVVPADGYSPVTETELIERLHAYVGRDMEIRVERVDAIERTLNGKFRAVVSEITQERAISDTPDAK